MSTTSELQTNVKPLSLRAKIIITIACALYVLSPIDVVPDIFPIVGWIDDAGVAAYLIKTWRRPTE